MAVATLNLDRAALVRVGMEAADQLVTRTTRQTRNSAVVNAPVDQGHLRASADMNVVRMGTRVVGGVVFRAPHALAVHDGSRAHTIRPRRGKVLRFEVGGEVVYARSVRHPGTRPRPFLFAALEQVAGAANFAVTKS